MWVEVGRLDIRSPQLLVVETAGLIVSVWALGPFTIVGSI